MELWGLIIASLIYIFLFIYLIKQKNKSQLQHLFIITNFLAGFWVVIMLLQKIFYKKYTIKNTQITKQFQNKTKYINFISKKHNNQKKQHL